MQNEKGFFLAAYCRMFLKTIIFLYNSFITSKGIQMHIFDHWKQNLKSSQEFENKIRHYATIFNDDISESLKTIHLLQEMSQECLDDLGPSLDDEQYCSVVEMNHSDTFYDLFKGIENLLDEYSSRCYKLHNELQEILEKASKAGDNKLYNETLDRMIQIY